MRSDSKYSEGCQSAEDAEQWQWLHSACCCQLTDVDVAGQRDFVRDLEIGHQSDHARDLEPSDQKIERGTVLVNLRKIGHEGSPLASQSMNNITRVARMAPDGL